jgi:hypothetical protein
MGPVGATASKRSLFGVDITVGWDQPLRTARKAASAHFTTLWARTEKRRYLIVSRYAGQYQATRHLQTAN